MRGASVAGAVGVVVCVAICMGGCSGPGKTAAEVSGAATKSMAGDHLSVVALLRSWFVVLYPRGEVGGAAKALTAACPPTAQEEDLGDGLYRYSGINSDCSTFDWTFNLLDQSGYGTQTWPDGMQRTSRWSEVRWEGLRFTQDQTDEYSDGTRVTYTISADLSLPEAPCSWDGQAIVADGRAMRFVLQRASETEDHLRLTLPDGWNLDVRIPLTSVPGAAFWPVFTAGARGEYRSAAGDRLAFSLTGEEERWVRWEFASPEGVTGAFALAEGLAGDGVIEKGGELLGALRWTADGSGTLYQTAASASDVAPSAAARAFQMDRWVHTIAAMGPAPMY